MTELATVERSHLPAPPASIVNLHSFKEVCDFAKMIADTEMVPQHFQKNPQAIVVAIQWGVEIGVPPMQALQNIAVINGRPSIWGDLGKAIVQSHPELAGYSETYDPGLKLAQVTIKRRRSNGAEIEITGDFSWQDAVDAKLSGKNTYQQYARDMLMWRAFWRAARGTFADALRGLSGAEESRDMERVKPADAKVMSEAAAELNESLSKKLDEAPDEVKDALLQGEFGEPNEARPDPFDVQRDPLTASELARHNRGTPAEPLPQTSDGPRDKRQKDELIQQCERDLDMLGIQKDAWLNTARELGIRVPDKAASLRGLGVEELRLLQVALAKEVSGDG